MGVAVTKEQPLTRRPHPFHASSYPCRHEAGQVGQTYMQPSAALAAETPMKLNTGRIVEDRIVLRL